MKKTKKSVVVIILSIIAIALTVNSDYGFDGNSENNKEGGSGAVLEATGMDTEQGVCEQPEITGSVNPSLIRDDTSMSINVQWIPQNPELPTGCEITALTMVLNYYGFAVSKTTMASEYLPKGGLDFRKAYVGNPFREDGFGCYAQPIVVAARQYFTQNNIRAKAVNISGSSFDMLLNYVRKGIPVIVWNTMNLEPSYDSYTWENGDEGEAVTWRAPEHCVVLIGYNQSDGTVLVADPLVGIVKRDRTVFEERYLEMYSQAVYITAN